MPASSSVTTTVAH